MRGSLWQLPAANLEGAAIRALYPWPTGKAEQPVAVNCTVKLSELDHWLPYGCPPIPTAYRRKILGAGELFRLAQEKGARDSAFYLAVLQEHGICEQTTGVGGQPGDFGAHRDLAQARQCHMAAMQNGSRLEHLYRWCWKSVRQLEQGECSCYEERLAHSMVFMAPPPALASDFERRAFKKLGLFLLAFYAAAKCPASAHALAGCLRSPEGTMGYFDHMTPEQLEQLAGWLEQI